MSNTLSFIKIFSECVVKAKDSKDEKFIQEEYFLDQVMKAGLASNAKEWFMLGVEAIKFHDLAPVAYMETIKKMAGQYDQT